MTRDNPLRHFVIAFAIALGLYMIAYGWIEHRRNRKGPWEVTFSNGPSGPLLVVSQAWLGITNVQLSFPAPPVAATNLPLHLDFREPHPVPFELPFGKCVFMDTTFLPGTLTFQLFGHEIEFLPRVMILDHEEHSWRSGEIIQLEPPAVGAVTESTNVSGSH